MIISYKKKQYNSQLEIERSKFSDVRQESCEEEGARTGHREGREGTEHLEALEKHKPPMKIVSGVLK